MGIKLFILALSSPALESENVTHQVLSLHYGQV